MPLTFDDVGFEEKPHLPAPVIKPPTEASPTFASAIIDPYAAIADEVPQAALAEIDRAPGLNERGKRAVIDRQRRFEMSIIPPAMPQAAPAADPYVPLAVETSATDLYAALSIEGTAEPMPLPAGIQGPVQNTPALSPDATTFQPMPVKPAGPPVPLSPTAPPPLEIFDRSAEIEAGLASLRQQRAVTLKDQLQTAKQEPVVKVLGQGPDVDGRAGILETYMRSPETAKALLARQAAGAISRMAPRRAMNLLGGDEGDVTSEVFMRPDGTPWLPPASSGSVPAEINPVLPPPPVVQKLRDYYKDVEGRHRQAKDGLASGVEQGTQLATSMVPTIAASLLPGGAVLAPLVAGAQGGGDAYEDIYTRLESKGYDHATRDKLARQGSDAAALLNVATAGILNKLPGGRRLITRAAERLAEGVMYGGAQAYGTNKITEAATGDTANLRETVAGAAAGGGINVAIGLIADLFTRGRSRRAYEAIDVIDPPDTTRSSRIADRTEFVDGEIVRENGGPPSDDRAMVLLRDHFAEQARSAKTPEDVEKVVKVARAVREAMDEPSPEPAKPASPREAQSHDDASNRFTITNDGSGYNDAAFEFLRREGIGQSVLEQERQHVTGKTGTKYELFYGKDDANRPSLMGYRRVADEWAEFTEVTPAPRAQEPAARAPVETKPPAASADPYAEFTQISPAPKSAPGTLTAKQVQARGEELVAEARARGERLSIKDARKQAYTELRNPTPSPAPDVLAPAKRSSTPAQVTPGKPRAFVPDEDAPTVEQMMKGLKAPTGQPGISSEDNVATGLHFVYRNEVGEPVGILRVEKGYKDPSGDSQKDISPIVGAIAVRPEYRRNGIATQLYDAARKAGFPIDEATGQGGYTRDGAALTDALRARGKLGGQPPTHSGPATPTSVEPPASSSQQPAGRVEPGTIVHYTDSKGSPAVGRVEGRDFARGGYKVRPGRIGDQTTVAEGKFTVVDPASYKVGDKVELRGYRGVSEITEYNPSTGEGFVVDHTSRRLRFNVDQVLPARQDQSSTPPPTSRGNDTAPANQPATGKPPKRPGGHLVPMGSNRVKESGAPLLLAARMPDGRVVTDPDATNHADLMYRATGNESFNVDGVEFGFAKADGEFMSRDQAAAFMKQREAAPRQTADPVATKSGQLAIPGTEQAVEVSERNERNADSIKRAAPDVDDRVAYDAARNAWEAGERAVREGKDRDDITSAIHAAFPRVASRAEESALIALSDRMADDLTGVERTKPATAAADSTNPQSLESQQSAPTGTIPGDSTNAADRTKQPESRSPVGKPGVLRPDASRTGQPADGRVGRDGSRPLEEAPSRNGAGDGGSGLSGPSRDRGPGAGAGPVFEDGRGRDGSESGSGDRARGVRPADSAGSADAGGDRTGRGQSASGDGTTLARKPEPSDTPSDAGNFVIRDAASLHTGGAKTKFRDNVEAISLMRRIEGEGRTATPSEQAILAKYTGWGAMPGAFNTHGDAGAWSAERDEIRSLLTDEEWNAAAKSTLNAHYTAGPIVEGMWDMARQLGFNGGRVLEPAMGAGNFFGLIPGDLRGNTRLTGVELDKLTGRIAKLLYPRANVQVKGFEELKSPDKFFDLVISNFPFGDFRVHDPAYDKHRANIHDYFFLKSVDKTRPGGLVMAITSTGTMDKANSSIRGALAEKADLVAAFRLPSGAFKQNAGTDVVTDIIILKRRAAGAAPAGESWQRIAGVPDPDGGATIPVNEYFVANPKNILGRLDRSGTMYGAGQVNVTMTGDVGQMLREAIERLPEGVFQPSTSKATAAPKTELNVPDKAKSGAFIVQRGAGKAKPTILRNVDGALVPVEMDAKQREIVADSADVRDAMRELVRAQVEQRSDAAKSSHRKRLEKKYDDFVKKHGPLNLQKNVRAFGQDPDAPNVLALEKWDAATKTAEKADIFFKDTVRGYQRPTKADTPSSALGITLNESGRVDLARIAELLERDEATVGGNLTNAGLAYENPAGGWESAEQYLSGNVRRKLVEAREAAQSDSKYRPNVQALEKVQPADVPHDEIDVRLGAPWVPPTDVTGFAAELFGGDADQFAVSYLPTSGDWLADYSNGGARRWSGSPQDRDLYGTPRAAFPDILEAALNNKTITIRDRVDKDTTVVNHEASAAANAKVTDLKEKFREWIWQDDARRERLHRYYNDTYNNLRPIQYDGKHLTFPGMNPRIRLNEHQANAVWRTISTGTGLYAHEVGTGKTFTMVAAAMELRRLGLARKPAIVALKATMETIVKQAKDLYPSARILAVEKFDAANRKQAVAKIATGDWDMVILSHDNVDMLPMSPEATAAFIQREIDELTSVILSIEDAGEASGRGGNKQGNRLVKRLEKAKLRLEERLKSALAGRKDDTVTFEETGIDQLFVDEAHKYKSLPVYTKQDRVKGVPTSRSDRATSMWMRAQWLQDVNNGRGVVFATGTPITNTMAELYTMQRYLQMRDLRERGVAAFDAWAATFGDVTTSMEYTVTGEYKPVSRFAKFVNLPELMQLARTIMDVKRADDIPDFKRPKRQDDVKAKPMSDAQRAYMGEIQRRAEAAKKKKPGEGGDNMLSISTDARKSAIDMRMVDPHAEFEPDGKLASVVNNVLRLHRENPGATQMIFSDIGVNPTPWGFSLYQDVIDRLVAGGIPRDKIINFGDLTDNAKKKAAERLNDGKALVAIGSTDKLGTGVNAQQYLLALHHLDVPWMPGFLEQRDGRAWRQGNTHAKVNIHRYVTEGSFDTFMWQTIDKKSRFIRQATDGKDVGRVVKDDDSEELTPAQVMAIASGNPLLLEKVQVDKDFSDLEAASRRHERSEFQMRDKAAMSERALTRLTNDANDLQQDLAKAKTAADEEFSIEIDGRTYTEREAAQEALEVFRAQNYRTSGRPVELGKFKGFDLLFARTNDTGEITVRGSYESVGAPSLSSIEVRTRPVFFSNALSRVREQTENLSSDLKALKSQLGKPFPKASALEQARQRRQEIQEKLVAANAPPAAAADLNIPSRAELEAMTPTDVYKVAKANGLPPAAKAQNIEALEALRARSQSTGYNPTSENSNEPNAKTGSNEDRTSDDRSDVSNLASVERAGSAEDLRSSTGESRQVEGDERRRRRGPTERRTDAERHLRAKLPDDFNLSPASDGWVITHPDGTTTPIHYVDEIPSDVVTDDAFAASLIAKASPIDGVHLVDGRRIQVPKSVAEYNALDAAAKKGFRTEYIPLGYTDTQTGEVYIWSKWWDVEGTLDEELFHSAFRRLNNVDKRAVVDLYGGDPLLAEEKAYKDYWQRPRVSYTGEPRGEQVIRSLRSLNVFRKPTQARPDGDYRLSIDRPSGDKPATRNVMRPRGVVNTGMLKTPVDMTASAASFAKGFFDLWSRPLIDNVEAQAGDYGKELAATMREVNDHARELLGKLHAPASAYLNSVSGGPGRNFLARRRAIDELQGKLGMKGKEYAFSRAQLAVEGKIPLSGLSPEAQEMVKLRRQLTEEIGKLAVTEGVQVVDPKLAESNQRAAQQARDKERSAKLAWQLAIARHGAGDPQTVAAKAKYDTAKAASIAPAAAAKTAGVRPFVPAKDGMRWFRAFTPELHTIVRLPDGSPVKKALAQAIADANGLSEPLALQHINDLDEGPLFKKNAAELSRVLEHFPAFIKHPDTGRWVELINTDPLSSGKAMVDNATRRLGFIHWFGQDLPGKPVTSDIVEKFSEAGGRAKDVQDAIRALNGIPLDHLDLGRFQPEPGTAGYETLRHLGTAYNFLKSAALTTAAVPNVLEPLTKTLGFAGAEPWVKGLYTIARHPFASRELSAAIGARTVEQMRWVTRPGHRIEDIARGISAILTAPLKLVNEWNELHAATTGMALASKIRTGKHPNAARATLDVLKFSPEQIDRMVNGRGTPEEYQAIATRFAERTQGSTSNPSEKSRLGNNPVWRIVVPFDQWAQMTANRTAGVIASYVGAIRSGDPARIARSTQLLGRYFFGAAAAGIGASFIYAWMNGGSAGVDIKLHEARDNPVRFAAESLMNSVLGGAAGRLLNAAESPRSTSIVQWAQSVSYPAMMLQDAVESVNGWGRYKDQTPTERAAGFFRNRFAINRSLTTLMAAWGLSDTNTPQEAAISAFYRWRREQPDIDQELGGEHLPSAERLKFRRAMKDFVEAMKTGNESGAQWAIEQAIAHSNDGTKGVAASLYPRRLLGDLDNAQLGRLKKRIGDDAFRRLKAYDELIGEWGASMKFETPTNRGVHARHGAALGAFTRRQDAIDEEFEPVKKQLTGNRWDDIDVENAHEDLFERRKAINAKARRLETIRKALKGDGKIPMELQGLTVEELNQVMAETLRPGDN